MSTQEQLLKNAYKKPMNDLAKRHEEITKKYKNIDPEQYEPKQDTLKLIAFNGYYSMKTPDSANGAFFTIDTNMHIKNGSTTPIYDVSLIVSMDGTSSETYDFTKGDATFDGRNLKLFYPDERPGCTSIILEIFRNETDSLVTASFTGTITTEGTSYKVSGETYNNPIPYTMYQGEYHVEIFEKLEWTKVLDIGPDYQLSYNFDTNPIINPNTLTAVPTYTYNLNMYFFSFGNPNDTTSSTRLIMGTSVGGGLVCNNMTVNNEKHDITSHRSIQTTKSQSNISTNKPLNKNSEELAFFSGYYPLNSIAAGAFVSIAGKYTVTEGLALQHEVKVGISIDGKTSKVYTIDDTMTFTNNTLAINVQGTPEKSLLKLTFKREYTAHSESFGSLVTMTGTFMGNTISTESPSYTPLNPVPLSAFEGVTMKKIKDEKTVETLAVNGDCEITYNGNTVKDFYYIPVMYILVFTAGEKENPVEPILEKFNSVLSLGTDGGQGNTCIITNGSLKIPTISVVTSIAKEDAKTEPEIPLTSETAA